MKKISFTLLALIAIFSLSAQHRSTFDDLALTSNSYWNGANLSGGFLSGDVYFINSYDTTYGSWSQFAYSNVKVNVDTVHSAINDYSFQYSAAPGAGATGSNNYAVSYTGAGDAGARLKGFASGHEVYGIYVANSSYTYLSMKYGDAFAKKFGGTTGTDPDWFRLTISGMYQGYPVANSVQVYLADYRSADTTQHYILKTWKFVDLLSLGNVDSLYFNLESSDTGMYGMNTPAYFCADNLLTTDGLSYSSPILVNDSFAVSYLDTITGNADTLIADILGNDSLSSFLYKTVTLVSGPTIIGARVHLDANNNLIYIPAPGVKATDTIAYAVCDELGNCDTAHAFIRVNGPLNTGIADIRALNLYLYPNPAYTHITLTYTSPIASVSIIDMSGREVLTNDINQVHTSIDIQPLSPGVYTIIVHTVDGIAVRRLVKE